MQKIECSKSTGNTWGKPSTKHHLSVYSDLEGTKLDALVDSLNECTTGSFWWEVAK